MTCAATTVLAGAAVAGTALSAYSMVSTSQERSAQADQNSKIATVNAMEATASADSDAVSIRRAGALKNDEALAAAGGTGLIATEGSPYDVMLGNAQQTELAAQRRLFQGKLQAQGNYEAASQYGAQNNPNGGYLAGGAQLLTGGVKAYQLLKGGGPNGFTGPAYSPGGDPSENVTFG